MGASCVRHGFGSFVLNMGIQWRNVVGEDKLMDYAYCPPMMRWPSSTARERKRSKD